MKEHCRKCIYRHKLNEKSMLRSRDTNYLCDAVTWRPPISTPEFTLIHSVYNGILLICYLDAPKDHIKHWMITIAIFPWVKPQIDWTNKASIMFLHLSWSLAASCASHQERPISDSSASTVPCQVILSWPRFLVQGGVHLRVTFGIHSGGIRNTCPCHLRTWCLISEITFWQAVLIYGSLFDI